MRCSPTALRVPAFLALLCTCWLSTGVLAAEVERLKGEGTLVRSLVRSPLAQGLELRNGDEVSIGAASEALVRITDKVAFVLRANSSITVSDVSDDAGLALRLFVGALRYVSGSGSPRKFRVNTQHVGAGVRGTDFDIVVVPPAAADGSQAGTYITVRHGMVDVVDVASGATAVVREAQSVYARAPGQEAPVVAQVRPRESRSRALTRPPVRGPAPVVPLEQVSGTLWRIDAFATQRGELDEVLDALR